MVTILPSEVSSTLFEDDHRQTTGIIIHRRVITSVYAAAASSGARFLASCIARVVSVNSKIMLPVIKKNISAMIAGLYEFVSCATTPKTMGPIHDVPLSEIA